MDEKLRQTGNKSTSYAWACLFNCAMHANDMLRNDLRPYEVSTAFIFYSRTAIIY